MSVLGAAAISAGSSLLGGLMNRSSAKSDQSRNIALQKEFAQNGIRWKVADAKAAGLHPLAALGASTATYTPVTQVGAMGDTVANMGQDISRAMYANASTAERKEEQVRMQAYNDAQLKLQTENMSLQNDLIRQQITTNKIQALNSLGSIGLPSNAFRGGSRVRGRGEIPGQGDSVFPEFKGWENTVVQVPYNKDGEQVGKQPAWINTSEGPILDTNLFEDQPTPLIYYLYMKKYGKMLGEKINRIMPSNKSAFPRSGKW